MPAPLPRDFHRILLIKPSAVGDVIHALPVLVKLRRRFPSARIDWLVTPANAELVRSHPALSNVVLFDRKNLRGFFLRPSAMRRFAEMMHGIRAAQYDLVIDLQGLSRSAWMALLSGSRTRIGFANAREWAWLFYTHRIPVPTLEAHAVERNLWLGPMLGLDDAPPDFRVHLPAEVVASVAQLFAKHNLTDRKVAMLAPGTTWETKHWLAEGFAEVAQDLVNKGFAVVLVGSPSEADRCRQIAQKCPAAVDLSGQTTLAELAEIIRRSALCVTNDSGTMHLAVAMDRPLVSIFGPTNPVRTGPYARPQAVVRAGLPCSPCYLRKLRQCPYDLACMKRITAKMVVEKIESLGV